ncbi:MAG TPA: alpha/beta hydrolase [Holophagaceae bacterium]|nr:alpha/beta hydrolase [Holophagaceae bacterium]
MSELALIPEVLEPSERGTLTGQGGYRLAWARWDHPAPKGRVVLVHGYGEHGERYAHTAKWLHDLGWAVSSLDQRGFGRSEGPRGDADGIRPFAEDLALFLRQERRADAARAGAPPRVVDGVPLPPLPVWPQIVLAHSFGGLVALLTLLWHEDTLDGLVLSSPAVALRQSSRALQILGHLLVRIWPHLRLNIGGDKSKVCSDPVLVQRYWADPLCHKWATPAFSAALAEGRREILPYGAELARPILLLEAGDDTVVDPDTSEALWSALPAGLLERHRLPGFYHEVFHDRRRAEAQALVEPWLEARLRAFPGGFRGNEAPGSATLEGPKESA